MIVYGLKNCDTCRAAVKALSDGNEVEFVDVRASPLPRDRLAAFLDAFGEALVNRRSATWRSMDDAARSATPLDALASKPALMKRPVIEAGGTLYLGWTPDVRSALLGNR
ncbi:MAG: arsenate reductase [Alphaproteobacteria bacterium]|nr:arsenate reductase [Alphaproteobacteria bacterium]NNF24045.1 arsenate reductase [Paracoccaceae bacterium]